ncbi:hypothetical protein F4860DRAFT_514951 [Xylaria cubensis]|nr:hypothetical protein F4860DRAFT_514951 [Xylaria cubensis]
MATPDTLLGPVLGAVLGALGAAIAAVIGAVVTVRLNRARQENNDVELQNEPGHGIRSHQQDRAQTESVNPIHDHRRAHTY